MISQRDIAKLSNRLYQEACERNWDTAVAEDLGWTLGMWIMEIARDGVAVDCNKSIHFSSFLQGHLLVRDLEDTTVIGYGQYRFS
jgi:hypothetical protein